MDLRDLGWNDSFEKHFNEVKKEGSFPARVAMAQRGLYTLFGESGEM